MSIEGIVPIKKSNRSKTHHGEPRKPEMILDIILMHDEQDTSWQDIGKKYKITRAGARHLYHKWYRWAKKVSSPPLSPKT